jgi:VanZ family protein
MKILSRRGHAVGLGLVLFLVIVASIAAYSSAIPPFFQRIPHYDKVCHFFGYGLLALFLDGVLRFRSTRRVPWAGAIVLVAAAVEEACQGLSPVRECSIWDFAADATGIAIAMIVCRVPSSWLPARRRSPASSPS